jgi:hypothetical protein
VPKPAGPDLEPGSARTSLTPYGPGAAVEIVASGKPATVYVLKWTGQVMPLDSDFTRVGITPVTFQLPPGTYLLEVEGPDVTRGTRLLEMRDTPKRLLANTGSEGLGTAGTLLMGGGIVAILAGTIMAIGGATGQDSDLNKTGTMIPLLAGGAALLGGGITMFLLSRTELEDQPSRGFTPAPAPVGRAVVGGIGFRL